jgi:4'-phosphopantetheinyl transferase
MVLPSRSSRRPTPPTDRSRAAAVQVWSTRVDEAADLGALAEVLDAHERARAERFRFQRDRARFVARRAFLRKVLAGYVGVPPDGIRYLTSSLGRPELDPAGGLTFSTSHADGLAVVAVASGRPVGVDLERVRPIPDALELASRFFSAREHEHLASLPDAIRSAAFLRLWTRKESYVKAIGAGMSRPFGDIDVLDPRGKLARRLRVRGGAGSFAFADLSGLPGYVGAVAVSGAHVLVEHPHVIAIAS